MKSTNVRRLMDQLGKLKAHYSYQCNIVEAVISVVSKVELQKPISYKRCRHAIEALVKHEQMEAVLKNLDLRNLIDTHNNRLSSVIKSNRYDLLASMEINSFMQEDFLSRCRKQYDDLQLKSEDCLRFIEMAQQYTVEQSQPIKQKLEVLLNDLEALRSTGMLEKCRDQFSHFVASIKDVFVKSNHDVAMIKTLRDVKREVIT